MTYLTDLSPEILHNLFCFVDVLTLANLSKTCHQLRDFIGRDDLLWRRVYASKFDEPRNPPTSWRLALQNLVRMEKIFTSKDYDLKRDETQFLGTLILPLLLSATTNTPSRNIAFLGDHFHHSSRRSNASTILRQSSLFRRCGLPFDEAASSVYLRQLSARLHVYSSLALEVRQSELLDVDGALEIHPYARSRVYDLRRYRASNFWGPFMDDGSGRVDWEKVQSIFVVLGYGLRMINERSGRNMFPNFGLGANDNVWCGLGTNSYNSIKMPEGVREDDTRSNAATAGSMVDEVDENDDLTSVPPLDDFLLRYQDSREARFQHEQAVFAAQDPYGVKGKWMRIVNFLDYHDLFAFNFTGSMPSDGIERDPVTTAEAFRLILLALWVTKIEWPDEEEGQPEDWETVDGSPASSSQRSASVTSPNIDHSANNSDDSPMAENSSPTDDKDITKTAQNDFSTSILQRDLEVDEIQTPQPPLSPTTNIQPNLSTEKSKEDSAKPPPKKSKYPIVHFEGRSRSLHIRWDPNANSHIRGSNPFYAITGYVRAYPSPPVPAHEYLPEGDPQSHSRGYLPRPQSQFQSQSQSHSQSSKPSIPPLSTSPPPNQTDTTSTSTPAPTTINSSTGLPAQDDLVIRWTTFSVFHGEERWRSEGVQIGGMKSARGILGNWFDKDYDPHGPAGPTGFWKLDDSVEKFGRGGQRAGGWDEEEDEGDSD